MGGKRSRAAVQTPAAAQAQTVHPHCSSKAQVHVVPPTPPSPTTKANNRMQPPTTGHAAAAAAAAAPQVPVQQPPAPSAAPSTSTHPLPPTTASQPLPPVHPASGSPSDLSPPSEQPNKKRRKKGGGHHHQQQQQQPAVPRDPVSAAVLHFERTYRDVPPERAREALEATQQHAANLNKWLEAAVEWVARMQEIQDEADEMARAMAASLQEEQLRRVAEGALWEQSAGALLARFERSYILRQVKADGDPALLLQGAAKRALVELLEQERRCTCQWFPCEGSRAYFWQLGEELRGQLPTGWQLLPSPQPDATAGAAGSGDCSTAGQGAQQQAEAVASTSGQEGASRPAGAEPADAGAAGAGAGAAAAPAGDLPPAVSASDSGVCAAGGPSAEALQQLADLLAAKTAAVVKGVSKMPETPGALPAIFQLAGEAAAAEDDADDIVEVVECRAGRQEEAEVVE